MVTARVTHAPDDSLTEVQRRVVAATESGVTQVDVARVFGVSRQTVARWVRIYRHGGEEMLRARPRGRRPGERLALSPAQQLWVINAFAARPPEELGLRYRMWTRQALVELINRDLGVGLSTTSIRNYMLRWGLPTNGSLLQALRGEHATVAGQASDAAARWLPEGESLWADWTPVRALTRPLVEGEAGPELPDVAMLRAVSNRGVLYFVAHADPLDGARVCDFLARLRDQLDRKINIVLNWQPRHNAEELSAWAAGNADDVAIRFSGR